MKTQKLLVIAAIVCLLVGASGAAMAEELSVCPNGIINGGEYETIALSLDFQDCVIVGVSVTTPAGVRVNNPGNFIMMGSYVAGVVRVFRTGGGDDDGSTAAILYNVVEGGNIVTKYLNEADVRWNKVNNGNIRVIDDPNSPGQYAEIIGNKIDGRLVARGNVSADVKGNDTNGGNIVVDDNLAAEVKNNGATEGNIRCSDNVVLDAFGNEASGGTVNCSRGTNGNGP